MKLMNAATSCLIAVIALAACAPESALLDQRPPPGPAWEKPAPVIVVKPTPYPKSTPLPAPTPYPKATPYPAATPYPDSTPLPQQAISQAKTIETEKQYRPKLNVLFVVDNSDSMIKHQQKLSANFRKFADEFEKNQRGTNIAFKIGVITVWDKNIGPGGQYYNEANFYEKGKLRPLKDPSNPGGQVPGPQYVKREKGFSQVLANTLLVGTIPFEKGGPRFEESFSPVLAALESQDEANKGFFDEDAHLAVVFVTDANDASPNLSGGELFSKLLEKKGGDRSLVSAFGVLSLGSCQRDYDLIDKKTRQGVAPQNIMDFVKMAGGMYYNLCDPNFGTNLAEIASLIREKAIAHVRIPLAPNIPEAGTLKVSYGNQPMKAGSHWVYDVERNALVLNGPPPTAASGEQAKLKIEMVPVELEDIMDGRARSTSFSPEPSAKTPGKKK